MRKEVERGAALRARPEQVGGVRREERDNGGLLVTVSLPRPPWMRWFTVSDTVERSFGLDILGREVYEACDGKTSVKSLIRDFARRHTVTLPEAETSVTQFLKTMMTKGLVMMAVEKSALRGDD
jgi:hypothetical protein